MLIKLKEKSKRFYSSRFSVVLFALITIFMNAGVFKAQAQDVPPGVPETFIIRSTTVFVNEEVIEIFRLQDSNEKLLGGAQISVAVEDPDIASIRVFDPSDTDQTVVTGSVLIVKTNANGLKAFAIAGLDSGSTKINFEVIGDNQTTLNTLETINVDVFELDAVIETDKSFGEAPLTVQFFDRSLGKIDARLWKFGDPADTTSVDRNPSHTFDSSGLFNVSLGVSQGTSIGTITDFISFPICVTPTDIGLPGVIFGTVFNPETSLPISNVEIIMLSGAEEKQQRTGRDGTYRFENILPGKVIFTVCKSVLYDCIIEELDYDGGALPKNFQLNLKEEFKDLEPPKRKDPKKKDPKKDKRRDKELGEK